MLYLIKKYLKVVLFILKIDWINTLRINLGHLPLNKGNSIANFTFPCPVEDRSQCKCRNKSPEVAMCVWYDKIRM